MIRETNPSPLHAAPPPPVHAYTHAHAPRSAPQLHSTVPEGEERPWKTLVHGGYLLPWLQAEMKASEKGLIWGLDIQSSWVLPIDPQAGTTATLARWAPGFCMCVREHVAAHEAGLLTALVHINHPLNNDVFLLLGDFQSIPRRHFSASPSPVPPLQILPSLQLNFWINCNISKPNQEGRGSEMRESLQVVSQTHNRMQFCAA